MMLRSIAFAAAFYLSTAVFLLLGSWLLIAPRRWAMQGLRIHGLFCLGLLRIICGTRLEVRGYDKMPKGAVLVVAKHQSAWDTFALVPLFTDPAIVLKDELKWIPFYGWFCLKFEHTLVRRDRASVALKHMLADAASKSAQGRQIVIFPEGTRRAPGAEPDYKPGYVALYERLGVPCVPLALNSGLYWPRRSLARYPGAIIVELLDPIPPGLSRAEFRLRCQTAIEEATQRLIEEAAASSCPPPNAGSALARIEAHKVRTGAD